MKVLIDIFPRGGLRMHVKGFQQRNGNWLRIFCTEKSLNLNFHGVTVVGFHNRWASVGCAWCRWACWLQARSQRNLRLQAPKPISRRRKQIASGTERWNTDILEVWHRIASWGFPRFRSRGEDDGRGVDRGGGLTMVARPLCYSTDWMDGLAFLVGSCCLRMQYLDTFHWGRGGARPALSNISLLAWQAFTHTMLIFASQSLLNNPFSCDRSKPVYWIPSLTLSTYSSIKLSTSVALASADWVAYLARLLHPRLTSSCVVQRRLIVRHLNALRWNSRAIETLMLVWVHQFKSKVARHSHLCLPNYVLSLAWLVRWA